MTSLLTGARLAIAMALAFAGGVLAVESPETYTNHLVLPGEGREGIADPHFIRYNGRYYLYPTAGRDRYVKAWESEDLVTWRYVGIVTETDPRIDRVWGPHVKYWNGSFYMYVNAPGSGEGDHAQYVLRSESPTGPFIRQTEPLGLRLSPTVFVDDDHQWYIFNAGKDGVIGFRMDDPYTFQRPGTLLNAAMDFWTEGPKMFKRNDIYYLMYTGDHWLSRGYREAYATANDGPLGTFAMAENNPIAISTEDDFYGLGNGFVLRGPDLDSYYFLYHHLMPLGTGNTRKLNVDPVVFNGKRMSVLGPTHFPQPKPARPDFYTWLDEDGLNGWESVSADPMQVVTSPAATERYFTAEYNFHTETPSNGFIGAVFSYRDPENFHYAWVDTASASLRVYARVDGNATMLQEARLPEDFDFSKLHTIRVENGMSLKVFFDEMKKLEVEPIAHGGQIGYVYQDVQPVLRFTAFSNQVNGSGAAPARKPVPGRIESIHASATSDVTWNPYVPDDSSTVVRLADDSYAVTLTEGAWIEYLLNVKEAGDYAVDLMVNGPVAESTVEIAVDGDKQSESSLLLFAEGLSKLHIGNIRLEQGHHRMRLGLPRGQVTFGFAELRKLTGDEINVHESLTSGTPSAWRSYGQPRWVSSAQGYATESDGNAFVVLGDPAWTDYAVEVSVTLDEGARQDVLGAGLLLRVTNPSYFDRQSADSMMGYYVEMLEDRIVLKRLNYGSRVLRSADVRTEPRKTYRLRAEVDTSVLRVYFEDLDEPVIEYTDPNAYMHGAIGLRTSQSAVHFRDLTVSQLDDGSSVQIVSPQPGATVYGYETVHLSVADVELRGVRIDLDGERIYDDADRPTDLGLRSAALDAGRHRLEVIAEDTQGHVHRHAVTFWVEHLRLKTPSVWGERIGVGSPIEIDPLIAHEMIRQISVTLVPISGSGNAEELYSGAVPPGRLIPDPLRHADGPYDLVVRLTTVSGVESGMTQRVVLNNWDEVEDGVPPPSTAGWFGVVDRMKTVDRSDGWEYVGGDPEHFFGDHDRIRPQMNAPHYLTWELAGLHDARFVVYTREVHVEPSVAVSVSADGDKWHRVPYAVDAEQQSAAGWRRLALTATVPDGLPARYVRFESPAREAGAEAVQLGHVLLRSLRPPTETQ